VGGTLSGIGVNDTSKGTRRNCRHLLSSLLVSLSPPSLPPSLPPPLPHLRLSFQGHPAGPSPGGRAPFPPVPSHQERGGSF
jgi:hypothetical protein